MLVHPAGPSNSPQLPHQIDRGPPSDHDVPVGRVWRSLWGVCDRAGVQYPDSGAAAVLLFALSDELGAVFEVWAVSPWSLILIFFDFLYIGEKETGVTVAVWC